MIFARLLLGLTIIALGFHMILRTDIWLRYFGDINSMLTATGTRWVNWKSIGLIFILAGFIYGLGLLNLLINMLASIFLNATSQ
jgi:hypothetical protein